MIRRLRTAIAAAVMVTVLVFPAPAHADTADQVCQDVNALLQKWGWQAPC